MTAVAPELVDSDLGELQHAVCGTCWPLPLPAGTTAVRALCGTELLVDEWELPSDGYAPPAPQDMCVVCHDLEQSACPRCGQRLA